LSLGVPDRPKKENLFSNFLRQLREHRLIETLAAFIGGGWLILEFVHWILIDHYHFPEKTLDITFVSLGCALLCTILWRWFQSSSPNPRRIKVELILIPLIILVALLFDSYLFLQMKWPQEEVASRPVWKNSIAVLPFKDLSPEQNQEIFCEGMTDDVITKLGSIAELKVISPTSSGLYKDTRKPLAQIGEELRVSKILEGTLRTEKDNIRVNVKLIDTRYGFSLWSKNYEAKLTSYFRIEDEIADDISHQLQLQLIASDAERRRKREPANFEAYKAYQSGRIAERKYRDYRQDKDFETSRQMLEAAIKLEPTYALAYWELGNLYEARYVRENEPQDFDLMGQYFRKSFELNPGLGEANLGLGWLYFYTGEMDLSYESFRRAVIIDGHNAQVNFDVGSFLRSLGLYSQAIKHYLRAVELDPFSIRAYLGCADSYFYLGKYQNACRLLEQALALEPDNWRLHLCLARQRLMLGEFEGAEKEIQRAEKVSASSPAVRRHQAWLWAAQGEKDKALSLIAPSNRFYSYEITSIYALVGKKEEAIKYIEEGIAVGFQELRDFLYSYPFLVSNPYYASLRNEPAFQRLLAREKKKYVIKEKKYGNL